MHFKLEIAADGKILEFKEYEGANRVALINLTNSKKALIDILSGALVIEIEPNCIEVSRDCDRQIFYRRDPGNIIVLSSDPKRLFLSSAASINQDYFMQYLFCGSLPSTLTPFSGIEFLSPGCRIFNKSIKVDLVHPTESQEDILDSIESMLEAKTLNRSKAVIEYSGGLESNILLHAINRIDFEGKVKLVHITAHESGEVDDIAHVKKMAGKFDCELEVVNQLEYPPFQITSSFLARPNFPNSGLVNTGYTNFLTSEVLDREAVAFNGSGGDAIFCACPQQWRPAELICQGRPLDALRSLLALSEYFRMPVVSAAVKSLAEYRIINSKLLNPSQYFSNSNRIDDIAYSGIKGESFQFQPQHMPREMSLSVRDRYINALINKYEMHTTPLASIPSMYQFPFLTNASMSSGLSVPTSKLLNGKVNRYYLRKVAAERYGEVSLMKTRKGGCAGLTQKIIRSNKKALEEFMADSCFSDLKIIDPDKIRRTLNSVAAGATYCPRSIINLFTACLFIHQWRGDIHADI